MKKLSLALLLFLPGCKSYLDISSREFPQGEANEQKPEIAYNYIRSAKVYDEYMTLGIFDALWLSDETRRAFVDLFSRKRGRDETFKTGLLQRELDENQNHITFYVLADVRGDDNTELNDRDAIWSMYLQAPSGEKVPPQSITHIELSPEIKSFFAWRATNYKEPYEVKFPVTNLAGNAYLDNSGPFKLVLSSVQRNVEMIWGDEHPELSQKKKKYVRVIKQEYDKSEEEKRKDEDFYWI